MPSVTAPRQIEAYPRLDAAAALRRWRQGSPGILWRNRFGHVIGWGRVCWISPVEVELDYLLRDTPYIDATHAVIRLPVRYIGSTSRTRRAHIPCGRCREHKRILSYKDGRWACDRCQGLVNRSTIVGHKVRLSEQHAAIDDAIALGPPKGMRQAAYDRLAARKAEVECMLGGRRYTAHAELLERITIEWVRSGPVWDGLYEHALALRAS